MKVAILAATGLFAAVAALPLLSRHAAEAQAETRAVRWTPVPGERLTDSSFIEVLPNAVWLATPDNRGVSGVSPVSLDDYVKVTYHEP